MRGLMVQKMKEVKQPKQKEVADECRQTLPLPAARSTPDTRKRPRDSTASPEASLTGRTSEIRRKKKRSSPQRRRNLAVRAKKRCSLNQQREWSYASILRELKKRVNPDELGATVQGIRETRSKDLLVELTCSTKSRENTDNTFKEVVGARGTVRHLIPRIEIEIADLEPTIEAEDVEDAVRNYFGQGTELELRVS